MSANDILAWIAALVMAGVVFLWATLAGAADPCWEKHSLSIRFDTLGVTGARRLKDDERAAAVRWFNSQEPISEGDWATFILAELPDGSGLILIGREEAVCMRRHVPPGEWLKVKLQMLGIPV